MTVSFDLTQFGVREELVSKNFLKYSNYL